MLSSKSSDEGGSGEGLLYLDLALEWYRMPGIEHRSNKMMEQVKSHKKSLPVKRRMGVVVIMTLASPVVGRVVLTIQG